MSRKGKRDLVPPVFRGHAIAPEVKAGWDEMVRVNRPGIAGGSIA